MARLTRGVRVWLGSVLGVALTVALIGVLGGWQTSQPRTLPLRAVGDTMSIPDWDITVREGASVVNYNQGSDYGTDRIRIRLPVELVYHGEESASLLPSEVLQLRLPDGTVLGQGYAQQVEPWNGDWEPGVEHQGLVEFPLTTLTLDAPAPEQLEVLVHSQEPARGFLRSPGEMRTGPARWRIPMTLTDDRIPVDP